MFFPLLKIISKRLIYNGSLLRFVNLRRGLFRRKSEIFEFFFRQFHACFCSKQMIYLHQTNIKFFKISISWKINWIPPSQRATCNSIQQPGGSITGFIRKFSKRVNYVFARAHNLLFWLLIQNEKSKNIVIIKLA